MSAVRFRSIVVVGLLVLALVSCGKKGNPLPPLRPVPARIVDMAAVRSAGQVELRFTVPAANLDGTEPVAIDRVDIFALPSTGASTAPAAGALTSDQANLLGSVRIGRTDGPVAGGTSDAGGAGSPRPGERAIFVHATDAAEQAATPAMYYSAVPVAGTGRGRLGPPAAVLTVPLAPLPPVPADLSVTHDETMVRVTWTPGTSASAAEVLRLGGGESTDAEVLTPEPSDTGTFAVPVEFGQEFCVGVRAVVVNGAVTVRGPLSDRVCLTPIDRYPPPVPGGVRVVQDAGAVVVVWDEVEAADLAGYVVLRGGSDASALTPLFRTPIQETSYRDTTVVVGETYDYAVYSVDTSGAANVSGLSSRQTITVR